MLKLRHLLIAIVFLILASVGVNAITCSVETGFLCPAGTGIRIMGLSSPTNAHGQNLTYTTYYSHSLCCIDPTDPLINTCNLKSDVLMRLSSGTNAHAQTDNPAHSTQYTQDICLGSDLGGFAVNCTDQDTTCPLGFDAVASLSSETNAHIGGPNDYDTKLCCKLQDDCNFPGDCNHDCKVDLPEFQKLINAFITNSNFDCTPTPTGPVPTMELNQCNLDIAALPYGDYKNVIWSGLGAGNCALVAATI